MTFSEELSLLVRSRYPVLYIPTREEERVEAAIAQCAKSLGERSVYIWDFVEGYQGNPNDAGMGKRNPVQALEFIEKLAPTVGAIVILRDFHRFLEDVSVARKLRNLARALKSQPKNIIILSPQVTIPDDLSEVMTVLEFPLPNPATIREEIDRVLSALAQTLDERIRSRVKP
jgi:hypothetical protein